MKLKHMTVQYNVMPDQPARLYYAFGVDPETGKMYESHMLVKNIDTVALNDEQLNLLITHGLSQGITEVTAEEQHRRKLEMRQMMSEAMSEAFL